MNNEGVNITEEEEVWRRCAEIGGWAAIRKKVKKVKGVNGVVVLVGISPQTRKLEPVPHFHTDLTIIMHAVNWLNRTDLKAWAIELIQLVGHAPEAIAQAGAWPRAKAYVAVHAKAALTIEEAFQALMVRETLYLRDPIKMIHTVSVTQEDIQLGTRSICSRCPVARAVARAFGIGFEELGQLSVTEVRIYFEGKGGFSASTPPCAVDFIRLFDEGGHPCPFSFDLDV